MKNGKAIMVALKFIQIFTISMSQILIDLKKGLGEKVLVQVLFFICLDGKGKIKSIMLFIKYLKVCKSKDYTIFFVFLRKYQNCPAPEEQVNEKPQ